MQAEMGFNGKAAKWLADLQNRIEVQRTAFPDEVREILIAGNNRATLAGTDRHGRPLVPWKVRINEYEGKTGPTLAPKGLGSRRATRAYTTRTAPGPSSSVSFGWRGSDIAFLGFHALGISGTGHPIKRDGKVVGFVGIRGRTSGIVRDVLGVDPRTREEIKAKFREIASGTWLGRKVGGAARAVGNAIGRIFGR